MEKAKNSLLLCICDVNLFSKWWKLRLYKSTLFMELTEDFHRIWFSKHEASLGDNKLSVSCHILIAKHRNVWKTNWIIKVFAGSLRRFNVTLLACPWRVVIEHLLNTKLELCRSHRVYSLSMNIQIWEWQSHANCDSVLEQLIVILDFEPSIKWTGKKATYICLVSTMGTGLPMYSEI